jgi:hypothetical protein
MVGMFDEMTCDIDAADVAAANVVVDPTTQTKAIFTCHKFLEMAGYPTTGAEPAFCSKLETCLETVPFDLSEGCGQVVACTADIEAASTPRCKVLAPAAEMITYFESKFALLNVSTATRNRIRFLGPAFFAPSAPAGMDVFALKTDGFSWRYADNYACDSEFVSYVVNKKVSCTNYQKSKDFAEAHYKDAGHWFKAYGLGKHERDDGTGLCDIAEWKIFQDQMPRETFVEYVKTSLQNSCDTIPGSIMEEWKLGSRAAYYTDLMAETFATIACGPQDGLPVETLQMCGFLKMMLSMMFPAIAGSMTDPAVVKAAMLEFMKLGNSMFGAVTAPARQLPHSRNIFLDAWNASFTANKPSTTPALGTANTAPILTCAGDCDMSAENTPTNCDEAQVWVNGCLADCNASDKALMLAMANLQCTLGPAPSPAPTPQ